LLLPLLLAKASTRQIAAWTVPLLVLVQVGFIFSAHWVLAATFIVLWSAGWTLTMLAAVTYRQRETPDRLQGRVNTVGRMLAAGIGTTGGTLLAGATVERVGITATLVLACSVGALAVPLAWKGHSETMEPSEVAEHEGMTPTAGSA
jgi:predicted MFS family arabinose efflux permease